MQDENYKYTDTPDFDARTSHALLYALVGQGESVLEIGCGTGALAARLREKLGCTVTGVELSFAACEVAREHTDRIICANVEEDAWEQALAGQAFDTLIVSDLLEHLRDPIAFLRRASAFLKEDGKLLFSVPNISHADVIAKLIDNRFDYTEKGLLDDTHLRHFAPENLSAFFAQAGLFLYHLDATVCPAGQSEQGDVTLSPGVLRVLREKKAANAYQLVGVACRRPYAEKMGLTFRNAMPVEANGDALRVYFDQGSGFSEENALTLPSPQADAPTVALLPSGTRRVRLCVRARYGYLIRGARFLFGERETAPDEIKGAILVGDDCLLTEDGSALFFDTAPEDGVFSFFGEISPVASDEAWETLLSTVENVALLCEAQKETETLAEKNEALARSLAEAKERADALAANYAALAERLAKVENDYLTVTNARTWKITKPLRALLDALKRVGRRIPFLVKCKKGFSYLRAHGVRQTRQKLRERSAARKKAKRELRYSKELLQKQREHVFPEKHVFSILVPLYNTPERFLREMIDSVILQTYEGWELCLADGSDARHADVERICLAYAKRDGRIKYQKLEKNLGISENTNACIDMATGDYIALFDHDDILHPAALYEFMCAVCDQGADFVYTDEATFESPNLKKIITIHHKPDFAIDNLRANNYICHFSAFSREVLEKAGKFRKEYDGSQDHDMILRLTEAAHTVIHIPKVLYYWRSHPLSVAMDINSKTYAIEAGKAAVKASIRRAGMDAVIESSRAFPTIYRIRYAIKEKKKISIIIPNKDHLSDLRTCLNSVFDLSTYPNYEIIIVDNGSSDPALFEYYEKLKKKGNVTVLSLDIPFNYPRLNNYAAEYATGDYLLFLNNDVEIITPAWMEEMLMYVQREDVGAAGAMLYYADGTIQHAGVILGLGEHHVAGHAFHKTPKSSVGYMGRLCYAQDMSAVTAACMMVDATVFREVGGFDETLAVAYNDVDLCLKIRKTGQKIVWTPYAEAYHYESKTRGYENASDEKRRRFEEEVALFKEKWGDVIEKGDPYYNPNFSLTRADFWII